MSKNSIKKLKDRAEEHFFRGEYDEALQDISIALMKSPEDRELKICAILSDMARENEEKAQAIFEYYQIAKELDENAEEIIEGLIESSDFDVEIFNRLLNDMVGLGDFSEDNSINYSDFLEHIEARGSFKRAYEDIMFSTKVMINSKSDFIDFLYKLVESGYLESAFNYCEAAITLFPKDLELQAVFQKIREKTDTK